MDKTIAVVGTFDTKKDEFGYLIGEIKKLGAKVCVIDVGVRRTDAAGIDVPNTKIAELGGAALAALQQKPRHDALQVMTKGAAECVRRLYENGKINGIISMGGSGGTTLGTAAMHVLPVGFPKMMVSTLAGTPRMSGYVGEKDIIVMNPVVDISGINSLTKRIIREAAGAIVGAVFHASRAMDGGSRRIAASMYGLTTPGVTSAKRYLENKGYEVITFHSTGSGGRAMEELICSGFFDGVLDMTLPEIHSHVLGAETSSAGPDRAAGAAKMGIPQVVCPGAMDMCAVTDFTPFAGRVVYNHNLKPSHIRPNCGDVKKSAKYLADQLNKTSARCAVFLPLRGLSLIDVPGKPMYDPEADRCLFKTLKDHLKPEIEVYESDHNVNDEEFAVAMAKRLDEMMSEKYSIRS